MPALSQATVSDCMLPVASDESVDEMIAAAQNSEAPTGAVGVLTRAIFCAIPRRFADRCAHSVAHHPLHPSHPVPFQMRRVSQERDTNIFWLRKSGRNIAVSPFLRIGMAIAVTRGNKHAPSPSIGRQLQKTMAGRTMTKVRGSAGSAMLQLRDARSRQTKNRLSRVCDRSNPGH